MIYDYGGFPDYTYHIRYDAPGDPALAARAQSLARRGGHCRPRLDAERGFDHGAFTPLKVMYPDADVPVVQLSLKRGWIRRRIWPWAAPSRRCATKACSSSAAA